MLFADGLDKPIEIPLREPDQNSPEAIVHKMAKVGASLTGVDLMRAAITVYITTVAPPRGSGRRKVNKTDTFAYYSLNEEQIVNVLPKVYQSCAILY